MTDTDLSAAAGIIKSNLYAVLATADGQASPWNSPVFICNDEQLNFYWASYPEAQHSLNIRNNPAVFMVIFDSRQEWGEGQGLYMRGTAAIVDSESEITKACELRAAKVSKNVQTAGDFMGESPRRIFKFTPSTVWVNNVSLKNGKIVDDKSTLKIEDIVPAMMAE